MEDKQIREAINDIARIAYGTAVRRGQYAGDIPKDAGERMTKYALRVQDEVAEAILAKTAGEWIEEISDVIIACLSVAHAEGFDIGGAVIDKMKKNITRIEGGKRDDNRKHD